MNTDINKKIAVIPSYQPDERLIMLTEALYEAGFNVITVDDGSLEPYRYIFDGCKCYAVVIKKKKNLGKGSALKTAYKYISQCYTGELSVVTLDSDGQHTVSDAVSVCDYSQLHRDSLIVGSRRVEKMPLRSRFGNSITRFVYRMFTKTKVYDTQSGLRGFSGSLLNFMMAVEGERYEYEMNVLLKCPKNNIPILEIPIDTIYYNNNKGSHFKALKDSARIYRCIFKYGKDKK